MTVSSLDEQKQYNRRSERNIYCDCYL